MLPSIQYLYVKVESLEPSLVNHVNSSPSRHYRNGAFEEMRGCPGGFLVLAIETTQMEI
jgi:hypothetical protein